jgi:hypothetical protein
LISLCFYRLTEAEANYSKGAVDLQATCCTARQYSPAVHAFPGRTEKSSSQLWNRYILGNNTV